MIKTLSIRDTANIASVRALMSLISTAIGIPFIRANQEIEKQPYPYFTYNVTSTDGTLFSIKTNVPVNDTTKVNEKHTKLKYANISLNFYNKKDSESGTQKPLDEIFEYAELAKDFCERTGIDEIQDAGLNVYVIDQLVQDRSALLDSFYEYRVGFDIRLRGQRDILLEVDAIDLDLTYAGITKEIYTDGEII